MICPYHELRILMHTPKIALQSPSVSNPSFDVNQMRADKAAPGFDQMLDLVTPQVEEIQPHQEVDDVSRHEPIESRQIQDDHSREQRVDRQEQSTSQHARAAEETQSVNQAQQEEIPSGEEQNQFLRVMGQLSQEDLLRLIQWQQGQGEIDPQSELAFKFNQLPELKSVSTGDLMALLNGFNQAQLPENGQFLSEGLNPFHLNESQLLQAANQGTQNLVQDLQAFQNMQNQPQMNQNGIQMGGMELVARPQEVMPALNLLKLSNAQKESIVKQVAQGFKTQGGTTQITEVRLHPEELGAVRLKIEVQGQDVRLFFSAENAGVQDLISQNIDQLKAMLFEQDFNLAEAGLFQDQLQGQEQGTAEQEEGEDYGSDERPDLKKRPKSAPRMSPLPGRFRATV